MLWQGVEEWSWFCHIKIDALQNDSLAIVHYAHCYKQWADVHVKEASKLYNGLASNSLWYTGSLSLQMWCLLVPFPYPPIIVFLLIYFAIHYYHHLQNCVNMLPEHHHNEACWAVVNSAIWLLIFKSPTLHCQFAKAQFLQCLHCCLLPALPSP